MKSIQFVSNLKQLLGTHGFQQLDLQPTPAPGVLVSGQYNGVPVQLEFDIGGPMTIAIDRPQSFNLSIRPESTVSRILDEVGHSREIKTGFADFDAEYLIRLDPPGERWFTPPVVSAVRALDPFDELTVGASGFRVRKPWAVSTYSAERALTDLRQLMVLAGMELAGGCEPG
ncbi:MAG: hypothetical protein AB1758_15045 [Candidatus Eremiobacterota bacterium]